MGQVVIEIPQNIRRTYRIKDSEYGEQLLKELEENTDTTETPSIIPPRRNSLKEDGDAVLGIWADHEESAQEIARKVRENNRKVT